MKNEIINVDIETMRKLPWFERQKVMKLYWDWRKRAKKNDVREIKRDYNKVRRFKLRKSGICVQCAQRYANSNSTCCDCCTKARHINYLINKIIKENGDKNGI